LFFLAVAFVCASAITIHNVESAREREREAAASIPQTTPDSEFVKCANRTRKLMPEIEDEARYCRAVMDLQGFCAMNDC
jgi:hypothetical protein